MAASATAKQLHLALAAVLFLALALAAAAGRQPPPTCELTEVDHCAREIIKDYYNHGNKKLLSPGCCNQLASQLGCGCLVRKQVLAAGIDIQEPFCVDGSGCTNY